MPPTLVLLPGMDGTGDLFDPLLSAIGDSIPTLVVRYPASEPLGYEALTELVRKSLPADRPFVILGESFSGPIAVKLAATAPSGLLGIILCASFISTPRPWLARFVGAIRLAPIRLLASLIGPNRLMGRFATPELRSRFRQTLAKVSPTVLHARARAVARVDVSPELSVVALPALYLQASEDSIVPSSAADRFAHSAAKGKVATVAGPHLLLQCVPEECARAIREFLTMAKAEAEFAPGGRS